MQELVFGMITTDPHNAKRGWFVLVSDVIMQWVYYLQACNELDIFKYKVLLFIFFNVKIQSCIQLRDNI